MVGERSRTQAWSRWFYEHPDLQAAHGLVYASAQTGHDAHVIWERAAGAITAGEDWSLGAPEIQDDVELAADELNLPLFPLP
jgi:predicted NAD/FAD-dependent oxidoreductase